MRISKIFAILLILFISQHIMGRIYSGDVADAIKTLCHTPGNNDSIDYKHDYAMKHLQDFDMDYVNTVPKAYFDSIYKDFKRTTVGQISITQKNNPEVIDIIIYIRDSTAHVVEKTNYLYNLTILNRTTNPFTSNYIATTIVEYFPKDPHYLYKKGNCYFITGEKKIDLTWDIVDSELEIKELRRQWNDIYKRSKTEDGYSLSEFDSGNAILFNDIINYNIQEINNEGEVDFFQFYSIILEDGKDLLLLKIFDTLILLDDCRYDFLNYIIHFVNYVFEDVSEEIYKIEEKYRGKSIEWIKVNENYYEPDLYYKLIK